MDIEICGYYQMDIYLRSKRSFFKKEERDWRRVQNLVDMKVQEVIE